MTFTTRAGSSSSPAQRSYITTMSIVTTLGLTTPMAALRPLMIMARAITAISLLSLERRHTIGHVTRQPLLGQLSFYSLIGNIRRTTSQTEMFLVSSCSCLCLIHWNQGLSREWRCSRSSADRRCAYYIWGINNFLGAWGATYIRSLTVSHCSSCEDPHLTWKWGAIIIVPVLLLWVSVRLHIRTQMVLCIMIHKTRKENMFHVTQGVQNMKISVFLTKKIYSCHFLLYHIWFYMIFRCEIKFTVCVLLL